VTQLHSEPSPSETPPTDRNKGGGLTEFGKVSCIRIELETFAATRFDNVSSGFQPCQVT
jgi:hypothetical protein